MTGPDPIGKEQRRARGSRPQKAPPAERAAAAAAVTRGAVGGAARPEGWVAEPGALVDMASLADRQERWRLLRDEFDRSVARAQELEPGDKDRERVLREANSLNSSMVAIEKSAARVATGKGGEAVEGAAGPDPDDALYFGRG